MITRTNEKILMFMRTILTRYWVISLAAPWVATHYSLNAEPAAFEEAMCLQCFNGIL